MIPTTVQQLVIVLVMLLPGVFYQVVREQIAGPIPAEREPQNRLMRALAVGALLDAVYALAAGPSLVRVFATPGHGPMSGVSVHPRMMGAAGLLFVVLIPAALAWAEVRLSRRHSEGRYLPVASAWDKVFRGRGSCMVRMRLKGGTWIGGWYGSESAAASYPNELDIYLEVQYRMGPGGVFGEQVENSGGVYVKGADIEILEFIEVPLLPNSGGPATEQRSDDGSAESAGEPVGTASAAL